MAGCREQIKSSKNRSVEIVQDMLVKTLFWELIVAGKRGLIGETISMVSICLLLRQEEQTGEDKKSSNFLPFPQGRANWRRCPSGHLRYATEREHEKTSVRMSSSYIAPARLWHYENCLMTIFSCSFVTSRKYSVEYFLRACPVFWTRQTPPTMRYPWKKLRECLNEIRFSTVPGFFPRPATTLTTVSKG